MIDFKCPCGQYKFSLPEDMAGGMIQCPQCRRLNDVPIPSELGFLEEDGSYKIEEVHDVAPTEVAVDHMSRAFTHRHLDRAGQEKDLRNTDADFANIGVGAERIAIDSDAAMPLDKPKYDPFTGELIRPVGIKETRKPRDLKKVVPVVNHASGVIVYDDDNPDPAEQWLIPTKLLSPINLIVMSLIVVTHLFSQALLIVMGFGFLTVGLALPVLQALILAHFGNVIDETGPTKHNELPAPLRGVSWHEDTGGPFLRMLLALTICYLPALFVISQSFIPWTPRWIIAAAVAMVGSFFAPAVMLTSTTSGTWLNLRPDRVLNVIKTCGFEYTLPAVVWMIAAPLYGVSIVMIYCSTLAMSAGFLLNAVGAAPEVVEFLAVTANVGGHGGSRGAGWAIAYAALIVGIFLTHWACWSLGLLYRRHHHTFAWVFQRHVRDETKRSTRRLVGHLPPAIRAIGTAPVKPAPTPVKPAATRR